MTRSQLIKALNALPMKGDPEVVIDVSLETRDLTNCTVKSGAVSKFGDKIALVSKKGAALLRRLKAA